MLKDFEPTYRLFENNSKIYIDYRPNSKQRIRRSLGQDYNDKNLKAIEKNIARVLLKLSEKSNNEKTKVSSYTFEKFGLDAIESASFNRSQRTQDDYVSKFKRLILPSFKDYDIEKIKAIHIDVWQKQLLGKPYSTTTVKRCKTIMAMIFDKAIANDIITVNPVKYSNKVHVTHTKQEPYTLNEMQVILNNTTGWFQIFMYVAFTTGMRPGEILGLKWSDIDFEKNVINLQRSISKGIITTDTYTKNHNRMVIIPQQVMEMIKKLDNTYEYIFVNSKGHHFYESKSVTKGYLEPFCRDFGIKYKGLKTTRHTYISLMRNAGASQELILDIVGHSKLVSDKHYYTNELTTRKQETVNGIFSDLLQN